MKQILIAICGIAWLLAGCSPGTHKRADDVANRFREYTEWLQNTLSNNPRHACHCIDSLSSFTTDSTLYYLLQIQKAKAWMFMSESDSAFSILHRANAYCSSKDSADRNIFMLKMESANMKGNLLARRGSIDSALVAFLEAYSWGRKNHDSRKILDIDMNLADAYVRKGRYDKGSFWYREALSLADTLQLPESDRFPIYYGLAQVNMELRDFNTCDYYYEKAAAHYSRMKLYEKHIYLNNRGNSYYFRGDYHTALRYFNRLLELVRKHPDMEYERNLTQINLGEVYLLLNQTDSAAYYLGQCRNFFQKERNISALYYIDTQLIALALKENNLTLAKKRLRQAVNPSFIEPNMRYIRNRNLQHFYAKTGDYKQAYSYLLANQRIDDSTRNERVRMHVADIVQKYRQDSTLMKKEMLIDRKENEVLHLHEWIYRCLFVIFVSGVGIAYWIFRQRKNREEAEGNLRMDIASLKLQNIRTRISPHFIFNVINRISANSNGEKKEKEFAALSGLIRKNLELADRLSISIAEELNFVRAYVELEKETLQSHLELLIETDKDIDTNHFLIPSMMLQIPVENSVKHALKDKEGDKKIWIHISPLSDHVSIQIRDNGGGYHSDSIARGTGTGLKIITRTIQLLNLYNKYPIRMEVRNVSVTTGETGCEVEYTIPYIYSYNLKRPIKNRIWERYIKR